MLIRMTQAPKVTKYLEETINCLIAIIEFYESRGFWNSKLFCSEYPNESKCELFSRINVHYQLRQLFQNTTPSDRQKILTAMRTDNSFITETVTNQQFCFQIRNLSTELIERINKWFVPFYSKVFTDLGHRTSFITEYKSVNNGKKAICPGCAGQVNLRYAQIDHYFPKAHYPTLAINPHNLIPLCHVCNSYAVKSNRFPSDPDNRIPLPHHNAAGFLHDVILPYHHLTDGLDEIIIHFSGSNGRWCVRIEPRMPQFGKRVYNLKKLFHLEQRWSDYINDSFEEELISDLLEDFETVYLASKTITESDLKVVLSRKIRKAARGAKVAFDCFIEMSYLTWIESGGFQPFYAEIVRRLEENILDSATFAVSGER